MIATPIGKVIFGGAAWRPNFLLRDDFTTTASAPLTSPRTAEPGPGTLTITDTNSKLSVATGRATFATGGVGSGDPGAWGAQLTRAAGLAVVSKAQVSTSVLGIGWDNNNSGVADDGFRLGAGSATSIYDAGGTVAADTIASSTDYQLAVVQRGTGFFNFIKGGVFTNWTLIWVGASGTGNKFPTASASSSTAVGTADFLRALQLPSPFNSDYGLATQRLAGARSALDAFTHTADCVLEFTDTTRPSASNLDLRFRRQDATNYWQVTIDSTGAFTLNEVVAGTPTQRATAAAVVSSGHRIVIVADGTTIRGYSGTVAAAVQRWTYASASNFATSTAGELTALGTSGVVNDLIAWPRQLSNPAAGYLDLSVA